MPDFARLTKQMIQWSNEFEASEYWAKKQKNTQSVKVYAELHTVYRENKKQNNNVQSKKKYRLN